MLKKIKNSFKNKLVLGSFIVTSSSLLANILAYLFQLLIGRALSVVDYGILIALFSLQSIISLPSGIIANAVTKKVTEIKDVDYPNGLSLFFYSLFKINLLISLFCVLLLFFLKEFVLSYLNISDNSIYIPFLIYVFFSLLFVYDKSFLQALHRYKAISALSFIQSLGKLFAAVIVLIYSLNLIWVFMLLALFILLFEVFSIYMLLKNINRKYGVFSTSHFSDILKFSLFSSLSLLGVSFIMNNDILLVKHLFSEQIAGYYSSSAIIGRIIFYGASPLAVVLFPICSERYFKKQDFLTPFIQGLLAVFALSFMAFIVFFFFPNFVVTFLFGDKYINSIQYLKLYSVYMILYTLVAVTTWLYVSISKLKIASLALLFSFLQYFLVKLYFNQTVHQVIWVSIICCTVLLFIYIIDLTLSYYRLKKVK